MEKKLNATTTPTTPATTEQATASAEKTTTPAKVVTISQAREIDEKNRTTRKERKDATEQAIKKLYRDDPVKALSECNFRTDRNETPILTTFEYKKLSYDSNGEIETTTETGEIRFDILFFADRRNKKDVNARFVSIGRTATEQDETPTRADGEKHLYAVRDIVREIGFPVLADSVNPSVVARIMRDGRFSTGKGNRQFDTRKAKLSLFGFLWATANRYRTTSAYIREQDEKEQARKAREQARKDAKKTTAKKKPATAKKTTATPAK